MQSYLKQSDLISGHYSVTQMVHLHKWDLIESVWSESGQNTILLETV
jgi:hypothetical protein